MQQIPLTEKNVTTGLFQFIFPFSLQTGTEQNIFPYLEKNHFQRFQLNQLENERAFYGRFHVSHHDIEGSFLPITNKILFSHPKNSKGFLRYSKILNQKALLKTKNVTIPFDLHSIDVTICPFDIGFLTVRTEITCLTLSDAIEFAASFRELQLGSVECQGMVHQKGADFLFEFLFPGLPDFFKQKNLSDSSYQAFPFLESERMYVHSLLYFEEGKPIDAVDVYRSGYLHGLSADGKPYISSNNLEYVQSVVRQKCYNCWGPNRIYFSGEQCFTCLTSEGKTNFAHLVSQFYGELYYSLILNLFHQFMFLKISDDYSNMDIQQDTKKIEKLTYMINSFTSNYFFIVYPAQRQGKELYNLLRRNFEIDYLYNVTKEILFSLFKYQENTVTKKDSLLLLILTLYTMICGIFSMNLFTHDLQGTIHWSRFKSYNPFEYIAVFVVFSGLIVAVILLLQGAFNAVIDRKNRIKWIKQTFRPSKKQ